MDKRSESAEPPANTPAPPALLLFLFLLIFGASAVLHATSLVRLPSYFVDEGLTLSRTQSLMETGSAAGPLDREVLEQSGSGTAAIPHFSYWLYSLPLRSGLPLTIPSLRWIALAAGLVCMLATAAIAWQVMGVGGACVVAAWEGFAPGFIWGSHIARPDVAAAALGMLGVAITWRRSDSAWRGFVGAFFSLLSLAAHLRGLIPLAGHLCSSLSGKDAFRGRPRFFIASTSGCLCGLALFAFWQLSGAGAYPATLAAQSQALTGAAPPVAHGSFVIIFESLRELDSILRSLYPTAWPLLYAALPLLYLAHGADERRLAAFICASLLAGVLLIHGMVRVKMIVLAPAFDLLIALALIRLIPRIPVSLFLRRSAFVLSLALVAAQGYRTSADLLAVDSGCAGENDAFQAALEAQVGEGTSIMSEETYWPLLMKHRFLPWKALRTVAELRGTSLEETLVSFHPDYFLIDNQLRYFLREAATEDRFVESMRVSGRELFSALSKHGALSVKMRTACYGDLELWRLRWETESK